MGVESGIQGSGKAGEEAETAAYKQDAEMLRKACTFPLWQALNTVELLMVLFSDAICSSLIKCQIIERVCLRRSFLNNDLAHSMGSSNLHRHAKKTKEQNVKKIRK